MHPLIVFQIRCFLIQSILLCSNLQTGDIDVDNDSEMLPGSCATSLVDSTYSRDTKVYEVSNSEDDNVADVMEVLAKSAEAQLSMYVKNMYEKLLTSLVLAERLGKDRISPIYVFFNCMPHIKRIDGCHVHVFVCAASHCKGRNGRDVCRFLDTGDAKSTSGLH